MSQSQPLPVTADKLAALVRTAPGPTGVLDVQKQFEWLADVAAEDVVLGRLAEGHVDALRILFEAGRQPYDGTYGVWASASGGTGLVAVPERDGWLINGTMRFCSGAEILQRALIVAAHHEDKLLLDIDARRSGLIIDTASWPAVGMSRSESYTITATDVFVPAADLVGPAGFYLDRAGFSIGGIGVAAVWAGAARGLSELVSGSFGGREPNQFQLSYLGGMEVALAAAESVLQDAVRSVQSGGTGDLVRRALVVRSVVERSVSEILDLASRTVGPAGLCLDGRLATHIADLGVYIRQHHGAADLARLATIVRAERRAG